MSANQRKNKNKKKKTAEFSDCHSTGSAIIQHVDDPSASQTQKSSLKVEVLFTGRKGSTTGSNKVYMCASDIRTLGLQSGGFVLVNINPVDDDDELGATTAPHRRLIVCQAWPSSEMMRGSVSLTRFWLPSFPHDSRRDVVVSRLGPGAIVRECSAITFSVQSPSSYSSSSSSSSAAFDLDELAASSAFRRYLAAALCEAVLCLENTFLLSWRGEPLTFKVRNKYLHAVKY